MLINIPDHLNGRPYRPLELKYAAGFCECKILGNDRPIESTIRDARPIASFAGPAGSNRMLKSLLRGLPLPVVDSPAQLIGTRWIVVAAWKLVEFWAGRWVITECFPQKLPTTRGEPNRIKQPFNTPKKVVPYEPCGEPGIRQVNALFQASGTESKLREVGLSNFQRTGKRIHSRL